LLYYIHIHQLPDMTKHIIHRHRIRIRTKHLIHALDIPITRQFIIDVKNHLLFMQGSLNENEIDLSGSSARPTQSTSPFTSPLGAPSQVHYPPQFSGQHLATPKVSSGGITGWLLKIGIIKRKSQAITILLAMSIIFIFLSFFAYKWIGEPSKPEIDPVLYERYFGKPLGK